MPETRSPLLQTLAERGFLHRCTDLDGLDSALADGPIVAVERFDASSGLHAGHLVQIMSLRWLQQCGHKPVILARGAELGKVLSRYLAFGDGPADAVMVDAAPGRGPDREAVPHHSEAAQEAAALLDLVRRHGCVLRMGGSDRWTLIAEGIALARSSTPRPLFGLATPRLPAPVRTRTAAGTDGPVWLSADRLSPAAFREAWRRTRDDDVPRFLRLYTELPLDEVRRLARLKGPALEEAKEVLADTVTRLAHGTETIAMEPSAAGRALVGEEMLARVEAA